MSEKRMTLLMTYATSNGFFWWICTRFVVGTDRSGSMCFRWGDEGGMGEGTSEMGSLGIKGGLGRLDIERKVVGFGAHDEFTSPVPFDDGACCVTVTFSGVSSMEWYYRSKLII